MMSDSSRFVPSSPPASRREPRTAGTASADDPGTSPGERIETAFRFLAHDPLPIGGVAAALVVGTSVILGVPVDLPLLVAAICGTTLVYGADRAIGLSPEDRVNRPDRVRWVGRHRTWMVGESVLLTVVLLLVLPFLRPATWGLGGIVAGLAVLYVAPVLPGGRRLKDFGLSKPVFVTAIWAIGAVAFPAVESGWEGEAAGMLVLVALVVYRATAIGANVLLADWGDRAGDRSAGRNGAVQNLSAIEIRTAATGLLSAGGAGVAATALTIGVPAILWVDAVGILIMIAAVWTLRPGASSVHLLLLDLAVAWPVATLIADLAM
jgi:4-hydroxybenzoate polyprenyltransferase